MWRKSEDLEVSDPEGERGSQTLSLPPLLPVELEWGLQGALEGLKPLGEGHSSHLMGLSEIMLRLGSLTPLPGSPN